MRCRTALCVCTGVTFAVWAASNSKASQPQSTQPLPAPVPLAALSSMQISANPMQVDPINGFSPQVVFGLTDEQNHSDSVIGYGSRSSNPGGSTLPVGSPPLYVVGTIDSGSAAYIFSYDDYQAFNFASAGREGAKFQTVQGVSGEEDLLISDAIGIYMTGFANATAPGGGPISVTPGSLRGQWNVPVLSANPEDLIPNVIGSPILSQYRVTIQNSVQQHMTVGSTTYRTPAVTLGDFSSTLPAGYAKLTLKTSDQGPPDAPFYINYDLNGPDNPDSPGVWSYLLTQNANGDGLVNLSRGGSSASQQTFLLDTGAQLSIISNDTATALNIQNPTNATADFTVDVLGVGGIQTVPGYYLDSLTLNSQGNTVVAHHVAVIVLDVADPRDPSQAIPGVLGTNVFNDRDLILNANVDQTAQTYLGIGPEWMWKTNGSGSWSNAANWQVVLPNGIDTQANFFGAITSDATVTVDSPVTVGSIAFDNANRYTLAGPGTITMSVSVEQSQINVFTGSHTIASPVVLGSDTVARVMPATSTLTMSGNISSAGNHGITKIGPGTLVLSGQTSYTGTTTVQGGVLELGNDARGPVLSGPGGADIRGGRLVFNYLGGSDPATTVTSILKSSHDSSNFATGQIRSSTADATHGLGWIDNALASRFIVAYTFYGDSNLDGIVDVTDLGALATNWQTSNVWAGGDFNYDGFVDVTDLGLLATNWQMGADPASAMSFNQALASVGLGNVSIPEPTSVALLGLAIALTTRRRRTHT